MKSGPRESDWKRFEAMVPELRERYLRRKNAELSALLQNEKLSPTERFWEVAERVRREATILTKCLDGHSRTRMPGAMALMHRHGMLSDADLALFSADLADSIRVLSSL